MTATAERTLPIPAGHREFTVKVDGEEVGRENQLLSLSVVKSVNRIASARLGYLDGSAATNDFPLSNAGIFTPGRKVEISAGTGDDAKPVFSGIVVRQSLRVRERSAPQFVVECRHAASRLAVGRRNACFLDQKDSDIIADLLNRAGLDGDVEDSSVTHAQVVQYRATDWDFLLARAEANGKLVSTNDAKVAVRAPAFDAEPTCTLQFGATVLELDADIDARLQAAGVTAVSWDPAQQEVVESEAAEPPTDAPGNQSGDDLAKGAGIERDRLVHTALTSEEAKAWADAAWLKSRMSKVSGRVKCEGMAAVSPGDIVALAGMGDRVSGKAFVTGVRHECDLVQGWKTHLQFGGVDGWSTADTSAVTAPAAGALVPAVRGLQIGTVVSNEDDKGEHRVRIRLPLVDEKEEGVMARVASLDAGAERGFFFRPELGDEVLVGFLDDDPRQPVLLGMLHSSAKAAPLQGSDDNHEKCYQSRSKMRLYFDDDQKIARLETPAGNSVELSEKDKSLVLKDQSGNKISLTPDGITIESVKAIELKAGTDLTLQSGTALSAKGGTSLKLNGATSAELSSAATTKVTGGLVQIN
jgi:Rhs element Vgr protein